MEKRKQARHLRRAFLALAALSACAAILFSVLRAGQAAFVASCVAGLSFIALSIVMATERTSAQRRLIESESIYRQAITQNSIFVFCYDAKAHTATPMSGGTASAQLPSLITNVPETQIASGTVPSEYAEELRALFAAIDRGEPSGSFCFPMRETGTDYAWHELRFSRTAVKADTVVVSIAPVSEEDALELGFADWMRGTDTLPEEKLLLLEYDLEADQVLQSRGTLIGGNMYATLPLDVRTHQFVSRYVHPDDAGAVKRTLDRARLLQMYRRGVRQDQTECRLMDEHGSRWLNIAVRLAAGKNGGTCAYILFEDIDEEKRAQLQREEQYEEDDLTRALRREVFIDKVTHTLGTSDGSASHAFFLVDVDHFKQLNDTLGHEAADSALREIAAALRSLMRPGDLFGRLGGDEFGVFTTNVPYDAVVEQRAERMLSVARREVNGVQISASVGAALYPRDGRTFDTLNKHADAALLHTQNAGGNGYTLFSEALLTSEAAQQTAHADTRVATALVVDADDTRRASVAEAIGKRYRVLEASNGARALNLLHECGPELSAVLASEDLSDMTAAELLARMRQNRGLASVPVVVMGGGDAAGGLRALGAGAADYCAATADSEELLLRVQTADSRRENDRLRAQNSYLLLQGEEEARYRSVVRSTGTMVIEYDSINGVFRYDAQMNRFVAGRYDERPLWIVLQEDGVASADDAERLRALMEETANRTIPYGRMNLLLKAANGEMRFFRVQIAHMEDEFFGSGKLIVTLNDVHDEAVANERMRALAERDSLTGLLNRSTFMDAVQSLIADAPPNTYVMMYFDVDRFKAINDRFGHAAGDEFLRLMADRLRQWVGESGVCCRISADFFAACNLREACNEADLDEIADMLREHIRTIDGTPLDVAFSLGLYVIDDPSMPADSILDRAALAQASVKGSFVRRYAFYDESFRERLLEEQSIAGRMNSALENGEFDMYLQPQYNVMNGRIVGAEALARWIRPSGEVVGPAQFIPLFERNGFITKLDAYIWERACQALRRWLDAGLPAVPVAVNLSRVDLADADLANVFTALVQKYDLPPRMLRLEITEGVYADNPQQMVDIVTRLQEAGFTVEMDDFGSGYSSLNILKDVPVSALKLDMRFLTGGGLLGRGGSIISAVVRMAKWLDLSVTAEGVETPQQAAYLKSIGCDNAQGYLYAKPMPLPAFEELLVRDADEDPFKRRSVMEMPDAKAFWTPESLETLVFNSYVGGAAIIEFGGESVEILRANDKYIEMLRVDAAEFERIRRDPLSIMPQDDVVHYIDIIRKADETGGEAECITRRVFASGDTIYLRSRVRVLGRSEGRLVLYAAIEDVTAQRTAEMELCASQETLMAAAEHTRLYYWVYDIKANTAIEGELSRKLLSFPTLMQDYPESFLRTGYVHPDHVERYRALHDQLKAGAREATADLLCRWQDGYEWRKVKYTVIEDENGEFTKAIGTSESLAAYKELENRLVTAAQQSGIMTWVYDIKTRCTYQDTLDENGEKKTDVYEDVPESTIATGRLHPDDADTFRALYERIFSGERAADCLVRFRTRSVGADSDGWGWFRITYTVNIDRDGNADTAIGTAVNVTEHIRMQERYNEAVTYYEQLDPAAHINVEHYNLNTGMVESVYGPMPYEERRVMVLSHIPDEAQRAETARLTDTTHLREMYAGGTPRVSILYRIAMRDGTLHWLRTDIRLLLNPATGELMAFFLSDDVTTAQNMDLAFDHLVHTGYDFVSDLSVQDGTYHTYVKDVCDQIGEDLRYGDFAKTIALHIERYVAPRDRAYCMSELRTERLAARLRAEGEYSLLYHLIDENGKTHFMSLRVFPLDAELQHIGLALSEVPQSGRPTLS